MNLRIWLTELCVHRCGNEILGKGTVLYFQEREDYSLTEDTTMQIQLPQVGGHSWSHSHRAVGSMVLLSARAAVFPGG